MKILWILLVFAVLSSVSQHVSGTSNYTRKRASDDYYQINYDYEMLNNNSLDVEFSSDSLILPIPDDSMVKDSSKNSDEQEETFNGDLKEHDLIDNLQYIYYQEGHMDDTARVASEIIIGGCAFSTIGQLLTIGVIWWRDDIHKKKRLKELFTHLMFSLTIANIAFISGIFKTKFHLECLTIALALTYFHLMGSVWIFLYCFHVFKVFCRKELVKRKYFFICGYGLPLIFSLVTFSIAPQTYETRKFCFMSVQKGMIMNYMVPIFCLLILTAVYCIKGIRIFNMELHILQANSNLNTITLCNTDMEVIMAKECTSMEAVNLRTCKACLRKLCFMQTMYDIVWFLLVLGLENAQDSMLMACVYSFSTVILHWHVFASMEVFFPNISKPKMDKVPTGLNPKLCNGVENVDFSPTASDYKQGSSDSVPLLIESTEMKILHHIPNISTISN